MKPKPRKQKAPKPDLSKPEDEWELLVDSASEGMRLDRFLSENLPWRSRSRLQRELASGTITVSGRGRLKPSRKLKAGEKVIIKQDNTSIAGQDPAAIKLDIVYEDEHLLAVNKEPGVVVHPVGGYRYNTLINALHLRYRDLENPENDVVPRLCHRIDKVTSGLLLIAKDDDTKRSLQYQFERIPGAGLPTGAGEIEKEYLAVTEGVPDPPGGEIDMPIALEGKDVRMKMAVRPDGLPSRTEYRVLENFGAFALVSARPHTGRTHQIRVHMAALGCPIICDHLYGSAEERTFSNESNEASISRCALHSARLRFYHPFEKKMMELAAPLADDMEAVLKILRNGGGAK